jgi:exodeoxyribonuclease VII large subunit
LRKLQERLHRQDAHRRVLLAQAQNQHLRQRLDRLGSLLVQAPQQRLARASAHLHALSPKAILDRGYALVYREDGTLLRNADNAREGESITARVASGAIRATVTGKQSL